MNKEKSNDAEAPALQSVPEQLTESQAQAAKANEYKDNWLRAAADLENFKKRAARERIEATHFCQRRPAPKAFCLSTPIILRWRRPLPQDAQGDKLVSLQTGIAMIQQQLKTALAEAGLEEMDAHGKPFDPTFHEAVSQQETDSVPEGQVLQQIRKGYKLRDRLLRPAAGR